MAGIDANMLLNMQAAMSGSGAGATATPGMPSSQQKLDMSTERLNSLLEKERRVAAAAAAAATTTSDVALAADTGLTSSSTSSTCTTSTTDNSRAGAAWDWAASYAQWADYEDMEELQVSSFSMCVFMHVYVCVACPLCPMCDVFTLSHSLSPSLFLSLPFLLLYVLHPPIALYRALALAHMHRTPRHLKRTTYQKRRRNSKSF